MVKLKRPSAKPRKRATPSQPHAADGPDLAERLGDAPGPAFDRWNKTVDRLEAASELHAISRKFDPDEWYELLKQIADIPEEHEEYAADWRRIDAKRPVVAAAARYCARLIRESGMSKYARLSLGFFMIPASRGGPLQPSDTYPSHGDALQEMLDVYLKAEPNKRGEVISRLAFGPLIFQDPYERLPELLEKFARLVDAFQPDAWLRATLEEVGRKNGLREYAKRRTFQLLKARWPDRAAPNKPTAMIVNCLLELKGSEQITANDVTQMNKGERRRYHRE